MSRAVNVGLIFHSFQSENLGVGAFTVCNADIVGRTIEKHGGKPIFHVIGARGSIDYSSDCPWPNDFVNVGHKSLANPFSDLHRTIGTCDVFFDIGAGDSFSDIYPASRYSRVVAVKMVAAMTGKPLVLSPQTIGPFTTWWGKVGAKVALRRARRIFARDGMSLAALKELGCEAKSELTTDLAFALPYVTRPKKSAEQLAAGNLEVGLNVSGLLFDLAGRGTGRIKLAVDYPKLIRRMITRLLKDGRIAKVHLVPHVSVPHLRIDDDSAASDMLCEEFPDLQRPQAFASPSAAKTFISGLDLFLGARMHSTIAAVSSSTAVLPMAYSRKFNGLYQSLDYPYLIDMVNEDEEAAMAELDRVLDNLPAVTAAADEANRSAQEKLQVYKDYVDKLIRTLISK